MRYRTLIAYDGAAYYGFQRQCAGQPTIQSELERALAQITREAVAVTGSGRTDSGVHALGQVVSFTARWQHDVAALQRALNANLPQDIVVLQVEEASPTFHPRYDARRRTYAYHIYNAEVRSPLRRLYSWYVSRSLNVDQMQAAAQCLVGTHDFATFGQPPQGENTVREVFQAGWRQCGDLLVFEITANAFLYRMVRSLVGSLKAVGEGAWTVDEFAAALRACDRQRSAAVAPACGLYLVSVTYDL